MLCRRPLGLSSAAGGAGGSIGPAALSAASASFARSRGSMGGGCQLVTTRNAPSRSSTAMSPVTYARPMPSWPGALRACPKALRVCSLNVGPPPFVGGSAVPSQNSMPNGRWGKTRAISSRSGAGLGTRPTITRSERQVLVVPCRNLEGPRLPSRHERQRQGLLRVDLGGDRRLGGQAHPTQVEGDRRRVRERGRERVLRRCAVGMGHPCLALFDRRILLVGRDRRDDVRDDVVLRVGDSE